MPIGSALTSDPLVLEGISILKQATNRDLKKAAAFKPELVIRKYDPDAALIARTEISREQQLAELEIAQDKHRKRSTELIDSFIAAIS